MKQICDLAHCSKRALGIILPSVQQQPVSVDCGVFAIAFAVNILRTCFFLTEQKLTNFTLLTDFKIKQ